MKGFKLVSVLVVLILTGCMTIKSYVDPTLPRATFADLRQNNNPQPVRLSVEFQTNGNLDPKATEELSKKTIWVLKDSRLFSSIVTNGSGEMAHIKIIMNNIADIDGAKRKGVGTGLTFGAVGSFVTDSYIFTAIYEVASKKPTKKVYNHAIYTTVGHKEGPEGLEPMSTQQAIYQVMEQLILNFLHEMQSEGHFLGK